MKTVKIKLEIDITDVDQMKSLNDLLATVAGGSNKKGPKSKSSKPSKSIKEEKPAGEKKSEKEGIKIEDVRAKLSKKVSKHRNSIKSKLTELEASNVTALDPKHYESFIEFLDSLEDQNGE